jgi:hypothetical protein
MTGRPARRERAPTQQPIEKYQAAKERSQKVPVHTGGIRCLSGKLDLDMVGRLGKHVVKIELLPCPEMPNPFKVWSGLLSLVQQAGVSRTNGTERRAESGVITES